MISAFSQSSKGIKDETFIENTTLSQEKLDSFRQHWADLNDVHHFRLIVITFSKLSW